MGAPSRFFKGCPQGPPSVDSGLVNGKREVHNAPRREGEAVERDEDGNWDFLEYVVAGVDLAKHLR